MLGVKNVGELFLTVFQEFLDNLKQTYRKKLFDIFTVSGNSRLAPIHTNKFLSQVSISLKTT